MVGGVGGSAKLALTLLVCISTATACFLPHGARVDSARGCIAMTTSCLVMFIL